MSENPQSYKKIGNYVLIKPIGQGQFSTVYKAALATDFGQQFAVKAIKKSLVDKIPVLQTLLQTEAKVMSKISHPNILHLQEFLQSQNFYYLVVDFCEKGDLDTYVKQNGPLKEEEAVYFLRQLSNAFKELRRRNVIHRDVKLANIFLQKDQVVLGDFGFAKQDAEITRSRLGTPITMAPEVLGSYSKSYTSKADLWSLGVIFYQMLFKRPRFDADNLEEQKEKIKNAGSKGFEFPRNNKVSFEAMDLICSLLQTNPASWIDWPEFFGHPLFSSEANLRQERLVNIRDSVVYRKNQEAVRKEFERNQIEKLETIKEEKKEEEELVGKNVTEEELQKKLAKELAERELLAADLSLISQVLFHNAKISSACFLASKEFKKLANMKLDVSGFNARFLLAGVLLCRKGILILQFIIDCLVNNYNGFKLKNFEAFLKTEEMKELLEKLESNLDDCLIYEKNLGRAIEQEQLTEDNKEIVETMNSYVYHEMKEFDCFLKAQFDFLKGKVNFLNIPKNAILLLKLAVLHLNLMIKTAENFPFIDKGQKFNWNNFHFDLNEEETEK